MSQITNLSTEILIRIFEYCLISDLCKLQRTCKRFYKIIKKATTLGNVDLILITNQLQSSMRNRCLEFFNLQNKHRISQNWRNGVYREFTLTREKRKYIPYLILRKEGVWLSKANQIHLYKRNKRSITSSTLIEVPNKSDICKFAVQQNYVVCGQRDGSIFIWNSKSNHLHLENCHQCDIDAIDFVGNIFVTGSKDEFVKLWSFKPVLQLPYLPISSLSVGDRVWSSKLNTRNSSLAVGTAGYKCVAPIQIFDLNRFVAVSELGKNFPRGAGVLGLKWEGAYMLMSCGYDNCVRNWDMRSGQCVQMWIDPFHSTVYCFETDSCCTLLSGTQSNGRVVLWDMRSVRHVQMYFMEACKKSYNSSPVYSLSFDAYQLFTATDRSLNVLNFSVNSGIEKNYIFIYIPSKLVTVTHVVYL